MKRALEAAVYEDMEVSKETGYMVWLHDSAYHKAGEVVGRAYSGGTLRVCYLGSPHRVAALAWLLHYREYPAKQRIVHLNGCTADMRKENLYASQEPQRHRKEGHQEAIRELQRSFRYSQETGEILRKSKARQSYGAVINRVPAGTLKYRRDSDEVSYRILLNGKSYLAKDIAWALIYRKWPTSSVVTLDGDPTNLRRANLAGGSQTLDANLQRMLEQKRFWEKEGSIDGDNKAIAMMLQIQEEEQRLAVLTGNTKAVQS